MSVSPAAVSQVSAVSGFTPLGSDKLEVTLTSVEPDLRLGRAAKLVLEVSAPAPVLPPLGDNWTGAEDDRPEPARKTRVLRFTLQSPDRAFLTGASTARGYSGTFAVTDGDVTRVELEATPVKRDGRLRISLYTEKDLDLLGDFELTLKAQ